MFIRCLIFRTIRFFKWRTKLLEYYPNISVFSRLYMAWIYSKKTGRRIEKIKQQKRLKEYLENSDNFRLQEKSY